MAPNERRRYTRIHFAHSATLLAGNAKIAVNLVDISLKGALIDVPETESQTAGEALTLALHLDNDVDIIMPGHAVHQHGRRLGLMCDEMDMVSLSHLRRLLELNMTPAASQRLLDELIAENA